MGKGNASQEATSEINSYLDILKSWTGGFYFYFIIQTFSILPFVVVFLLYKALHALFKQFAIDKSITNKNELR